MTPQIKTRFRNVFSVLGFILILIFGPRFLTELIGKDIARPIAFGLGMGWFQLFYRDGNAPYRPAPIGTYFILLPLALVGAQTIADRFFGDSWWPLLVLLLVVVLANILDRYLLNKSRFAQQGAEPDAGTGRKLTP